jgi:hypothetical protein
MGYVSMYGKNEHGYVEYSFPVQDSESATAMGLVPVDLLDLESLCVDQGNRRKESASDEVMCSRILSVSSTYTPSPKKSNESTSVDGPRIERRSRHTARDRRSTGKVSRRH